jgi:hypothetical protein
VTDETGPEIKAVLTGPNGRASSATPEEVAAVVAALAAVHGSGGAEVPGRATPRWRFSGRWWTKPVPARRGRPDTGSRGLPR